MNLTDFLNKVIEHGIQGAKKDYAGKDLSKLRGAIAGFNACKDKTIDELRELLGATQLATKDAFTQTPKGDIEKRVTD